MLKKVKLRAGVLAVLMLISVHSWSSTTLGVQEGIGGVRGGLKLEMAVNQLSGQGMPEYSGKVVQWLQPLAEQGNPEALLWLGRVYRDALDGNGKDLGWAFEYFKRAAGEGANNREAQYELGRAYFHGEGTDRNLIAAYMWTSLCLQESSAVEKQAREQQTLLVDLLSDAQLKSANILVEQMSSLYLGE